MAQLLLLPLLPRDPELLLLLLLRERVPEELTEAEGGAEPAALADKEAELQELPERLLLTLPLTEMQVLTVATALAVVLLLTEEL